MINHGDSLRAVKSVPLSIRRFYVQAYQSYLFNLSLSHAFAQGEELFETESGDVCFDSHGVIGKFAEGSGQSLALPFVGYSYYKKTRFDFYISKILGQEEVSTKDFFISDVFKLVTILD